jgi:predicted membrane protein
MLWDIFQYLWEVPRDTIDTTLSPNVRYCLSEIVRLTQAFQLHQFAFEKGFMITMPDNFEDQQHIMQQVNSLLLIWTTGRGLLHTWMLNDRFLTLKGMLWL